MSELHERLLEERERLGLNQDQFAEHGGVKRRAQVNYESGERCPDGHYFAGIAAAGADVQYILTGVRSASAPSLSPREAALLDNYRHIDDEGDKRLVERTAQMAVTATQDETQSRTKKAG